MLENSPRFKEHWKIPLHICWKISENLISCGGKHWKCWICRGYLNVLEMFAVSGGKHSGKFRQPCCLVLWHPPYMYVGILQQCLYSNSVRVDGLGTVGICVWSAYAYREHESEVFMYLQWTCFWEKQKGTCANNVLECSVEFKKKFYWKPLFRSLGKIVPLLVLLQTRIHE
jgi:hypothetical protein